MSLNTFLLPPITIPQDRLFRQLLTVFDEISLYDAAEDGDDDNLYSQNHLLKHYCPLPFGKDLPNFQKLIKDIKGNRAEFYNGGLFSMSTASQVDEGAVWQLVSDIMSPETMDDRHNKTMFEVRLILRLAEIATAEEEEICRELAKVNSLADTLLDELKDVKSEKINTSSLSSAVSLNLTKLVRAWAFLFQEDKDENKPWIATTANLEVYEMLADYYSTNLNEQPQKICSLPCDFFTGCSADKFLLERNNIHQSTVFTDLGKILKDISVNGVINEEKLKKIEADWQDIIKTDKPKLDFYLFRGVSLNEIFSRVTKTAKTGQSTLPPHGIVAVLKGIQ